MTSKIIELYEKLSLAEQKNLLVQLEMLHKKGKTIYTVEKECTMVEYSFALQMKKAISLFRQLRTTKCNLIVPIPNLTLQICYSNVTQLKYYSHAVSWDLYSSKIDIFHYGKIWTLLKFLITGFYKKNYPCRIFRLEYNDCEPGFSKRKTDKMTNFVMLLASINKEWRSVLKSKCVWQGHEWWFLPGTIDPPYILGDLPFSDQPRMKHINWKQVESEKKVHEKNDFLPLWRRGDDGRGRYDE